MEEQHGAVVEEALDEFRAPGEPHHGPALKLAGQPFGQGKADVGTPLDKSGDGPAREACRERAHGGLDFRQLGHRSVPADPPVAGAPAPA